MQRAKEISIKFSHTRPDGTDSTSILSEYGIPDDKGGENIAAGYNSPQSVIEGWMNSPGHRVALLNFIMERHLNLAETFQHLSEMDIHLPDGFGMVEL